MKVLNIRTAKKAGTFFAAILMLALVLSTALLGGCSSPASSISSASAAPSSTPVPTTQPDETPAGGTADGELGEDSNAITHGEWVYYLDVNDPVVVDFNEDPPVAMQKADGSGSEQLGIRGFQFDVIGDYLYVDSNDPDLDANGAQTWYTTRVTLDGSEKKVLEYASMSARLSPEGEQKFYFTTKGDSAIYISDFSCENVETLMVNLPDKSELDGKLDAEKVLQLDINSVENGTIDFDATFSSSDGLALYDGNYKMSADGKTVEKVKGTYFSYSSQNESD
jgi:hypothetical protein